MMGSDCRSRMSDGTVAHSSIVPKIVLVSFGVVS